MSEVNLHILFRKIKSALFQNLKLAAFLCCLFFTSNTITKAIPSDNKTNFNLFTSITKKADGVTCISPNTTTKSIKNESSLRFNKRFQAECGLILISHFLELFVCKNNFSDLNFSLTKCFTAPSLYSICLRGPPVF